MDEVVIISNPMLVFTDAPAVIWCRESRASKIAQIFFQYLDDEIMELDRGIVYEPTLSCGPNGTLLALWSKVTANETKAGHCVMACDPHLKPLKTITLSAYGSSSPTAAFNSHGEALAIWVRIEEREQWVEVSLGPDWGRTFVLRREGWNAQPSVCALKDGSFLIAWTTLDPKGGSVSYFLIDRRGQVIQESVAFAQENPAVRYIHTSCAPMGDGALIAAVRIEDVTSPQGIVDQDHQIAVAFFDPETQQIEQLDSPTRLNHGLLSDPESKSEVWGYLGNRLKPGLLPGGKIWWERKERHDGLTIHTTGVLCCKDLKWTSRAWDEEKILHHGGLAYYVALTEEGSLWLVHRPVIQGKTHQLVLEEVLPENIKSSSFNWLNPSGYSKKEFMAPTSKTHEEITIGGEKLRLYWGDPHVHSALSLDAEGEPDELMHYARDLARLDFVALTENDEMYSCWLTRAERIRGCEIAEAWTEEGKFVALNGFEYTRPALDNTSNNHRTVLLPDRNKDFFRWSDPVREDERGRVQGADHRNLDGLAAEAERLGAYLICHHYEWQLSDSEAEKGLEAVSGWDTYMHDPENIHRAWNNDRRLGLIGGSDGHRRTAGMGGACTGVWAKELSLTGILEGIQKRRTVATQGRRPSILFYLCDETGKRLFIGDQGKLRGKIKVIIGVEAEEGYQDRIELVELRHGEKILANWSSSETIDNGRRLQVEYEPYSFGAGNRKITLTLNMPNYLYLRIRFLGPDHQFFSNVAPARGPWAWTSPIWWE